MPITGGSNLWMPQVTQWQDFVQWWVDLEPELLRAAGRYGLQAGESQDVVQDLAVIAIEDYQRFSLQEEFRRWAFARIHWLLLDGLRSQKRRSKKAAADLVIATEPVQETELFADEILELIETLPKRQLKVMLRTIYGDSDEDIANEMKIKETTVRSLKRFGRSRLAMLLAKKEVKK